MKNFHINSISCIEKYPEQDCNSYDEYDRAIIDLASEHFADEYFFNAVIFPVFEKFLNDTGNSKFLYNCEEYIWLPEDEHRNRNKKPDGVICYSAFIEKKQSLHETVPMMH